MTALESLIATFAAENLPAEAVSPPAGVSSAAGVSAAADASPAAGASAGEAAAAAPCLSPGDVSAPSDTAATRTAPPAAGSVLSAALLDALVARYPWFGPARALREKATGAADPLLEIASPWRAESSLRATGVDAAALTALLPDDMIDRFLREEDLRIVAGEGEADAEVITEARLDDEDEVVSEELAEIYLAQGLRDKAAAIYRKLSLLNPEKSVYFAELIRNMENNN